MKEIQKKTKQKKYGRNTNGTVETRTTGIESCLGAGGRAVPDFPVDPGGGGGQPSECRPSANGRTRFCVAGDDGDTANYTTYNKQLHYTHILLLYYIPANEAKIMDRSNYCARPRFGGKIPECCITDSAGSLISGRRGNH